MSHFCSKVTQGALLGVTCVKQHQTEATEVMSTPRAFI